MQALHIDTPAFTGDILVTNNEKCKDKAGFGGMNIYDVTNPAHPTPLVEGFGDETVTGQGKKAANEIHSVFAWDAGDKAYAVIVDNEEGPDVDIVDITEPEEGRADRRVRPGPEVPADRAGRARRTSSRSSSTTWSSSRSAAARSCSCRTGTRGYVKLDVTDPLNVDVHRRHRLRRPRPGGRREPASP